MFLMDSRGVPTLEVFKSQCFFNVETYKENWKEEIKNVVKLTTKYYNNEAKKYINESYERQQKIIIYTRDDLDNNTNNKSLKYSLSKNKYRAFIVFLMQKYHITSKLGYLLFNIGCKTHELNFSLYDVIDNNGIKSLRALYKEDFNDYVQQTYNNIFYEDFTKWIKDKNTKRIKCYA
jgi:hypothetical protein